mgnify:CR=1 FL=1
MVEGTIEAVDVMVFIFVLGGMIGVINRTGSFNAGLMALARKTKGNESNNIQRIYFDVTWWYNLWY